MNNHKRPDDAVLIENAVRNARPSARATEYRWACVARALAVGSTTAHQLCREFGLDPYELLDGVRCEGCPMEDEVE